MSDDLQSELDAMAALRLRKSTRDVYRRIVDAWRASGLPVGEWWVRWSATKKAPTLSVARSALVSAGAWAPELDPAHSGLSRSVKCEADQAPAMCLVDFRAWSRWLRIEDPELWRCVVLAWWGGLRVSEAATICAGDVTAEGSPAVVKVRIRSSKTSDRSAVVSMPERPTMAGGDPAAVHRDLWDWQPDRRLWSRSTRQFARRFELRIKQAAESRVISRGDFTPHSMRAGIATELDAAGVGPGEIARHCRWRSMGQVLAYVRDRTESPLHKIRACKFWLPASSAGRSAMRFARAAMMLGRAICCRPKRAGRTLSAMRSISLGAGGIL